jgi:hypothetical protein
MAQISQTALDGEARRWLRPDWRRFFRPASQNDPLYQYYERIERKYDPAQPRVPAGVAEGGQWTSGSGATASAATSSPGSASQSGRSERQRRETTGSETSAQNGTQVAGRISPTREAECNEQYRKDTFICNVIGTQSCWEQAAFRFSQCLKGGYIPPLYH